MRYDLCVIGAGPAGFAAAMRAHDLGRKVVLIDAGFVGGTGVRHGALSSKTLWHLSNDYARAKREDRGYRAKEWEISFERTVAEMRFAVAERQSLFEHQLAALSVPDARGALVDFVHGRAKFVTPHAVEVKGERSLSLIESDYFLIATGSRPRVPGGITLTPGRIVTSDEVEDVPAFPKSMVVVGAGVVGCEYATIFGNFGQTSINVIDRQPRILPSEDEDVADVVARNFEDIGIRIHRASTLLSLECHGEGVRYRIRGQDGREETIDVELALISTGRVPNTESLGLEIAGVERDGGGGIVSKRTATTAPHVFAAGDVTADVSLVNIAELEGRHAAECMFGNEVKLVQYDALPSIMFLKPEVASAGMNELEAKKRGVPYRVGVVANRLLARNIAMRATDGFVKLLAAKDPPHRILGLRVVGPQASSTVQGVAFLIERESTLEDIDSCVHPHPAIPEGVQECARLMLGKSILKPSVFGPELLRMGVG